jgi:hypothetical protein
MVRFRLATALVISAMILFQGGLLAEPAAALGCATGQNKFVQRNNYGGSNFSYGSMGSVYQNEAVTIDTCGKLLHTVHINFSHASNLDFAEIGAIQYGYGRGAFTVFTEWAIYPYNGGVESGANWGTNQWMSFNVSNVSGTVPQFKFQYSVGTCQCNWTTYGPNTQGTASFYRGGTPLSEVERFGNTDAYMNASLLKWRPSNGGWFNWEGMTCATMYADLVADWDAVATSANSWQTLPQPHPVGDC